MSLKNKILGSLAVLLCLFSINASAIVITTSGPSPVEVGDSFDISVMIEGLGIGEAPSLGGFDLDISYDTSLFSFNSYALDVFLGDISLGEALDISWGDDGFGTVNLAELSLFVSAAELDILQAYDPFLLATLNFEAIADGTGEFAVSNIYALADGFGDPLSADTINNGYIVVTPSVPEPATLALLMAGLAGIGLKRKRFGR